MGLYLLFGLVFGIAFVIWWHKLTDESAKGTGIAFRIIILPGLCVFWPIIILRLVCRNKDNV